MQARERPLELRDRRTGVPVSSELERGLPNPLVDLVERRPPAVAVYEAGASFTADPSAEAVHLTLAQSERGGGFANVEAVGEHGLDDAEPASFDGFESLGCHGD
jgi:hypothetical protein